MPGIIIIACFAIIIGLLSAALAVVRKRLLAARLDLEAESDARQDSDVMMRQVESQYHALLEGITEGVVIVDSGHRIKMINQTMCDIFVTDPKGIFEQKCFEHLCGSEKPCENCPGIWSIASGKPAVSTLEMHRADGSKLVARIHSMPVKDKNGDLTMFMLIVEDITNRHDWETSIRQNERRYRTLFRELGEGFMYIKSENSSNEQSAVSFKILDMNPAMEELLGSNRADMIDAEITQTPLGKIQEFMEHMKAVDSLGSSAQDEIYLPELDKYIAYRIFRPSSMRIAVICRETTEYRLAEQQLSEAQERELEFGTRIQQTMLKGRRPEHLCGVEVAVHTIPSYKIDGDFHDFITYDSKHFDVIIGDVMGKGGSAALLGAAAKLEFVRDIGALLSASGNTELSTPEEIVNKVHAHICENLMELSSFVSACYARFNLDKKRLDYVDCGHTAVAHHRSAVGEFSLLHGDNMPLGFSDAEVYAQHSVIFNDGDVFVFYSDGLIQATDAAGNVFGEERLKHHITMNAQMSAEIVCQKLIEAVKTFTGKPSQLDDLTCIVVKIISPKENNVLIRKDMNLRQKLVDLVGLRNFIRACCQESPLTLDEEFISRIELAANETASNIIFNSGESDAAITVIFSIYDSQAVVDIVHSGQMLPEKESTSPALDGSDESGFSLFLIRNCVDKVEYDRTPDGLNRVRLIKYIA
ncbi:MAG TPA: SpoIIE family protein phosphatase [Phycisphaerae bacterium]|nr:SpoIIE family protein phosphatase [Phycisphaerae bacterium]